MTTTHAPPTVRKPRRWFMWTFLLVQGLFIVWLIAGIASVSGGPGDCGELTRQACDDAHAAGATIGVGLIIGLWVAVDFILAVTYLIIRLARRRAS